MDTLVFTLVLGSAFFHASWNFFTKRASGDFRVLWLAVAIGGLALLPASVYLLATEGVAGSSVLPLLASIIAHGIYYRTLTAAYRVADISLAYPIARGLGVAGTGLAGILLLRESVSSLGGVGIAAVFLGVLFVGRSGGSLRDTGDAKAAGIRRRSWLLAAATGGTIILYSVSDKLGVAATNPVLYLGLLNVGSTILTLPWALEEGRDGLRRIWKSYKLSILLVSAAMGGTYLLILWIFRLERASYIVAVRESSIIFAVLLGRLFLKEKINAKKAGGVLAILAGLVAIRLG